MIFVALGAFVCNTQHCLHQLTLFSFPTTADALEMITKMQTRRKRRGKVDLDEASNVYVALFLLYERSVAHLFS